MACWCDELNRVSKYLCFDCKEKIKEKKISAKERAYLVTYGRFILREPVDLKEFKEKFFEVEEIRKKMDKPRGDDCPCRKQDAVWRITCTECDYKTRWDNISEGERQRLDAFRSLVLACDAKGLEKMIKEEMANRK